MCLLRHRDVVGCLPDLRHLIQPQREVDEAPANDSRTFGVTLSGLVGPGSGELSSHLVVLHHTSAVRGTVG